MASRTYLPKLFFIVLAVCRYIGRWDTQIRRFLPNNALPAYEALNLACAAFVEVLAPLVEPE